MRIDIENMLRQAGGAAGNRYGYEYALQQLSKHLQHLRDRTLAADTTALKEFFTLYVFDDGKDYEDVRTRASPATAVAGNALKLSQAAADEFATFVRRHGLSREIIVALANSLENTDDPGRAPVG